MQPWAVYVSLLLPLALVGVLSWVSVGGSLVVCVSSRVTRSPVAPSGARVSLLPSSPTLSLPPVSPWGDKLPPQERSGPSSGFGLKGGRGRCGRLGHMQIAVYARSFCVVLGVAGLHASAGGDRGGFLNAYGGRGFHIRTYSTDTGLVYIIRHRHAITHAPRQDGHASTQTQPMASE
jgi:hypothetical protein